MNVEDLRAFCLNKAGTTESFPFDNQTLVFKVMGKMFALIPLENPELKINLKCEPEEAIKLREEHPCVLEGYHMSKKHWNTVLVDGSVDDDTIIKWVNNSYSLIVEKLPKKDKEALCKLI